EDGIRDRNVTGVQTCALPIYFRKKKWKTYRTVCALALVLGKAGFKMGYSRSLEAPFIVRTINYKICNLLTTRCPFLRTYIAALRSEERRVGKESRRRRAAGGE